MIGLGFDPFSAAVGLALAAGAVALAFPPIGALAGTLAALALAAWASRRRRSVRAGAPLFGGGDGWAVGVVALAGAASLGTGGLGAPGRALLLAAGLLPLWWLEHRRPKAVGSGAERP